MSDMKNFTKEDSVHILLHQSNGFSTWSSRYKAVTLLKCGRREARLGQFVGKNTTFATDVYLGWFEGEIESGYDKAAIKLNGREAVTTFELSSYEGVKERRALKSTSMSMLMKLEDLHLRLHMEVLPPC
ncbi:unnamed protein product [Cuscuta campestris]|uniref:AP2/ERF domain-containing protein n=1 Tax=Cuscuta campestris TaxID=132261 RepID=A0A484K2S7_9ASTE|nr:unnamed protein product [Cuscuta campestris]